MTIPHDSDCAIHNGPGLEPAVCDCSLSMLKNAIRNAAKTDITIPPEALEAAAMALAQRAGTDHWQLFVGDAEAACLAMLRSWPGMVERRYLFLTPTQSSAIFLPLQEKS